MISALNVYLPTFGPSENSPKSAVEVCPKSFVPPKTTIISTRLCAGIFEYRLSKALVSLLFRAAICVAEMP